MDKIPTGKIPPGKNSNPPPPKQNDRKTTIFTLSVATSVLVGIIGYELFREHEDHSQIATQPVQQYIIPPIESQNEQLQIQLNRSLQKVNELKRLLFVRNHSPENATVQELKDSLQQKEDSLHELSQKISQVEAALSQEKSKSSSLENSLAALSDLVEIQSSLKDEFQNTLTKSIADARQEGLEQSQRITNHLEDILDERNKEIVSLKAQIQQEEELLHSLVEGKHWGSPLEGDSKTREEAFAEAEARWKESIDEMRQQVENAQASIQSKDIKIQELADNIERLTHQLSEKEASFIALQQALDASYAHQAQLADELAIEKAFGTILLANLDLDTQKELIQLKGNIDLLQAELQVARVVLEKEKLAKAELTEDIALLINKSSQLESELAESQLGLLNNKSTSSLPSRGSLQEDVVYQIGDYKSNIAQGNTESLETLRANLESKYASLQKELEQAHLQVSMQDERERLLNLTLDDIKTQYEALQRQVLADRQKTLDVLGDSAQTGADVLQMLMYEQMLDQMRASYLAFELEQLSQALYSTEMERQSLKEQLDGKIDYLSEDHEVDELRISLLTQKLDEARQDKNSLLYQIVNLLELQENEKIFTDRLKEELEKSKQIQALLTTEVQAQNETLSLRQDQWDSYVQSHEIDKGALESEITALKRSLEEEKERSSIASRELDRLLDEKNLISERGSSLESLISEKQDHLQLTAQEREEALQNLNSECENLKLALDEEKKRSNELDQELKIALENFEIESRNVRELQDLLTNKEMAFNDSEADLQFEKNQEISILYSNLDEQNRILDELKSELNSAHESIAQSHQKIADLEKEIQHKESFLVTELQTTLDEKIRIQDDLENLKAELESYKNDSSAVSVNLLKLSGDFSAANALVAIFEAALKEKEAEVASLHHVAKSLQDAHDLFQSKQATFDENQELVAALERHLREAKDNHLEALHRVTELEDELSSKEIAYNDQLSQKSSGHMDLQDEIEKLKKELVETKENANQVKEHLVELNGKYEQSLKQLDLHRDLLDQKDYTLSEMTASQQSLLDEQNKNLASLQQAMERISELEKEIQSKEDALNSTSQTHVETHQDLQNQLLALQDELVFSKQDVARITEDLDALNEKHAQTKFDHLDDLNLKDEKIAELTETHQSLLEEHKKLTRAYQEALEHMAYLDSEIQVKENSLKTASQNQTQEVQELQKTLEGLQQELRNSKDYATETAAELLELSSQYEKVKSEHQLALDKKEESITDLSISHHALLEEQNRLNADLQEANQRIAQLEFEIESKENALASHSAEHLNTIDGLKAEIEELQKDLAYIHSNSGGSQQYIDQLKADLEYREKRIAEHQIELADKDRTLNELSEAHRSELTQYLEKIDDLQFELSKAQEKQQKQLDEMATLEQQIQSKEGLIQRELQTQDEEKQTLISELSNLKNELTLTRSEAAQAIALQEKLKEDYEHALAQVESYQFNINEKEATLRALLSEHEDAQSFIQQLQENYEQSVKQVADLTHELQNKEGLLNTALIEQDQSQLSIQKELLQLREELLLAQKDAYETAERNAKLTSDYEKALVQIDSHENTLQGRDLTLDKMLSDQEELRSELENSRTQCDRFSDQIADLNQQLEEKENLVARSIQDLETTKNNWEEELSHLRRDLEQTKNELSQNKELIERLNSDYDIAQGELESHRNIIDDKEKIYQTLATEYEDKISQLKEALNQSKDDQEASLQKITALEKAIADKENSLSANSADQETKIQEMYQQLTHLQAELTASNDQASHYNLRLEALTQDYENAQNRLEEYRQSLNEKDLALAHLTDNQSTTHLDYANQIAELREELNRSKDAYQNALDHISQLEDSILTKESSLSSVLEQNQARQELEQEIVQLRKELTSAQSHVEDFAYQIEDLKNHFGEAQAKLREQQDVIEEKDQMLSQISKNSIASSDDSNKKVMLLQTELNKTYENLQQSLQNVASLEQEIREREESLLNELHANEAAKQKLEQDLKNLHAELLESKQSSSQVAETFQSVSTDYDSTQQKISELEAALEEKQKLYNMDVHELNELSKQLEADLNSLKNAKLQEEERSKILEAAIQEAEKERIANQKILENLQSVVFSYENSALREQEERNTLVKQIDDLTHTLNERMNQTQQLEEDLTRLNSKYNDAVQSIENLQTEVQNKSESLSSPDLSQENIQEEIEQLKVSLEKEKKRSENFSKDVSVLQTQYENAKKTITDLQEQSRQLKQQPSAERLSQQINDLKSENASIKGKYQLLTSYLEEQKKHLAELEKEKENLSKEIKKTAAAK